MHDITTVYAIYSILCKHRFFGKLKEDTEENIFGKLNCLESIRSWRNEIAHSVKMYEMYDEYKWEVVFYEMKGMLLNLIEFAENTPECIDDQLKLINRCKSKLKNIL